MCGGRTPLGRPSRARNCPGADCVGPVAGIVVQHLTVARVAEGLGVSWDCANTSVLEEGRRVLINDEHRFEGVTTIGVDEHVVRHEALLFRMEVRDLHRPAVVAVG